jgi:hypothetical protein
LADHKTVLSDRVLMKTLMDCQSKGEKHAVIAMVEAGVLKESYVSPESAVKKNFPFNAIEHAFDYYSINSGVCIVTVRDGAVSVSVNGLVGNL